jgi:glycosyltransferase involved in cell wall biosynthesis
MPAVQSLCSTISQQIQGGPVEHLVLLDNKKRTVGEKRDALLRAARGQYVAFCDDDDWVASDYVSSILEAAANSPDVITFLQGATVNGEDAQVEFKLGNPNDPWKPGGTVRRNAWHICAWRRSLAICSSFPASNYGEDLAFCAPLWKFQNLREVHIPRVLHFYRHDIRTTAAPPPLTAAQ